MSRDDTIWEALLGLCVDDQPGPETLRKLNDAVAGLLCLRAGLEPPEPWSLPQEHLSP